MPYLSSCTHGCPLQNYESPCQLAFLIKWFVLLILWLFYSIATARAHFSLVYNSIAAGVIALWSIELWAEPVLSFSLIAAVAGSGPDQPMASVWRWQVKDAGREGDVRTESTPDRPRFCLRHHVTSFVAIQSAPCLFARDINHKTIKLL